MYAMYVSFNFLHISNIVLVSIVEGITLTPLNPRFEFWETMLSCYEIMNLPCQIIA